MLVFTKKAVLSLVLFNFSYQVANAQNISIPEKSPKAITVYGYPSGGINRKSIENFNPMQPENIGMTEPGLTVPKLGSLGQRTSLKFNSYASGDLTLLFDGFEISDLSDPSEGFDISNYLMMPDFSYSLSTNQSAGLFARQQGGVLSISPTYDNQTKFRTSVGSSAQTLLSAQTNKCRGINCYSLALGGNYANPRSASTNKSLNKSLERDEAFLGFLSFGWQRSLFKSRALKLRFHSQYSRTDIDDYNDKFIFSDDPNARVAFQNYFLGISYLTPKSQYFLENTISLRSTSNRADSETETSEDESYSVVKTRLRAEHDLKNYTLYWNLENLNLETTKETLKEGQSKTAGGLQVDQGLTLGNLTGSNSLSLNGLEGLDVGYSLSQKLNYIFNESEIVNWSANLFYGVSERRPSFIQVFDPQFGNPNLSNESLFFVRPQVNWSFISGGENPDIGSRTMKHNISAQFFYENLDSRVVFESGDSPGYANTGKLKTNDAILKYSLSDTKKSLNVFYKQGFNSEGVRKALPWSTGREWGLGLGYSLGNLNLSSDLKLLMDMFNPSGLRTGNILQSQAQLSYQFNSKQLINLQLTNIFNDKKVWDVGFRRQSFSWMLTLTKTI